MLESVRGVPGVLAATVTLGVPMRGSAGGKFEIFGRPPDPAEKFEAEFRPADPAYFATLGMTLDRGRSIDARDLDGAPPVALVNQKLAREFLGGNPIGQQIRVAGKGRELPWMTIVGVVRDTRHIGPLRDGFAEIYIPYAQFRSTDLQPRALIVRTAGDPERIVPALQRAVAAVDKDQPLVAVRSMERSLAEFIAPQRFDTTVMAIFAAIGLALTAVGIFGVMSYRVARRTHEIGVRMALGAERANVLRMVVAEAMGAAVVGLALGWAGAWALTRYLASLLFHVKPGDPVTLVSGSAGRAGGGGDRQLSAGAPGIAARPDDRASGGVTMRIYLAVLLSFCAGLTARAESADAVRNEIQAAYVKSARRDAAGEDDRRSR